MVYLLFAPERNPLVILQINGDFFDKFVAYALFVFEQRGKDLLTAEKLGKLLHDKIVVGSLQRGDDEDIRRDPESSLKFIDNVIIKRSQRVTGGFIMATGDEYFSKKESHSCIKHKVFQDTLTAALSIANRHSKQIQTFVYCDLYAGQGEFEDGSAGSPMIALDIMEKLSENLTMLRLELYFAEKDKKRAGKLSDKLASRKNHRNATNITVYGKCWQDNVVSLREHLSIAQWGFLFIDPFANQIDLGLLKELISENYRKDVIVFLNLQAVRRQAGSMKARKRVAEFLNIKASDLEAGVPDAELIDLIRNSFRIERKQYQMLATIPNSRKGRLTNSDYFALLCATNSVGVADSFLKSYAESVEMFKEDNSLDGLFGGISLETKIIELIDKYEEISLKDAFSGITKAFFSSWKKIDLSELPNTDNLIKAVNSLSEKGRVTIEAPEDLFYKKSSYKRLKKEARNTNEAMGLVLLRKKS